MVCVYTPMPDTGFLACIGESHLAIDSGNIHTITGVEAYLVSVTNPKVRVLGTERPQRLQFAGSYGLLFPRTPGPGEDDHAVVWSTPMKFTTQYTNVTPLGISADRLIFKLPLGLQLAIRVVWS
jgi:hypothetical protein